MDDFENAMVNAVNFSPDFIHDTFTIPQFRLMGILSSSENHTEKTINLQDLNLHGKNEHDASMSRLDKIQGDTLRVQPDLVQKILDDTVPISYPYLNTSSIGRTRVRREKESCAAGSGEPNQKITIGPGVGEGALALIFIGEGVQDGSSDAADRLIVRKERLREWLDLEKIPVGWRRSKKVVTGTNFLPLLDRVTFWRSHWKHS